jgi:hypothetical protein
MATLGSLPLAVGKTPYLMSRLHYPQPLLTPQLTAYFLRLALLRSRFSLIVTNLPPPLPAKLNSLFPLHGWAAKPSVLPHSTRCIPTDASGFTVNLRRTM